MTPIREALMSAIRRTAVTAVVVALAATAAFGLGLRARHVSGEPKPGAAFPAAASPADAARPSWALSGFRDQETWRETSPSPDAY
jgi:hypothetical protein